MDGSLRLAFGSRTQKHSDLLIEMGKQGQMQAASCDPLEIGVVVLTSRAKSVDAIGIKILSELVKLKQNELRE
jgi:hypothetical protein